MFQKSAVDLDIKNYLSALYIYFKIRVESVVFSRFCYMYPQFQIPINMTAVEYILFHYFYLRIIFVFNLRLSQGKLTLCQLRYPLKIK